MHMLWMEHCNASHNLQVLSLVFSRTLSITHSCSWKFGKCLIIHFILLHSIPCLQMVIYMRPLFSNKHTCASQTQARQSILPFQHSMVIPQISGGNLEYYFTWVCASCLNSLRIAAAPSLKGWHPVSSTSQLCNTTSDIHYSALLVSRYSQYIYIVQENAWTERISRRSSLALHF